MNAVSSIVVRPTSSPVTMAAVSKPSKRAVRPGKVEPPSAICPILSAFYSCLLGDTVDGMNKAELAALSPALQGSNQGEGMSQRRALMAADWLVRTVAPAWLDNLLHHGSATAAQLRALPPVTSQMAFDAAAPILSAALERVRAMPDTSSLGICIADDEAPCVSEAVTQALANALGATGLYAAANASRGPGAVLFDDVWSKDFPPTVQLVIDVAETAGYRLALPLAYGCAQGARLKHGTASFTAEMLHEAALDGAAMAVAALSEHLIKGVRTLLDQMIACKASDAVVAPATFRAHSRPADLIGAHSVQEVTAARNWLAIDWMTREAVSNLIDQVPELGYHAALLGALPPIGNLESLRTAQTALLHARADAHSVLTAVTKPWRDADMDGLDFIEEVPFTRELNRLYYTSATACGFHDLRTKFEARALAFKKDAGIHPWDEGMASLMNAAASTAEAVLHAALIVVMLRALTRADGTLLDECDPLGPAAAALHEVGSRVRGYYLELQAKLRAVGSN